MSSILVVEEAGVIAKLLQEKLLVDAYQIVKMSDGEDAVQFALREMPQLIIQDSALASGGKYQLPRYVRAQPKCMHIPIIYLSSACAITDKIHAFELGVDVYMTKPYNGEELLAHVRRQLSRVEGSALSPLTRLPGGVQLEKAIEYKIHSADPWSLLYLDLDHFKAFNDAYGFLAGNDMIQLVGHICQRVVCEYGNTDDFVGHVGGDDFVIVSTPDRERVICQYILAQFRKESSHLYRKEDFARSLIRSRDRGGESILSPLVSLSIGIISDYEHKTRSRDLVGFLAAEAKLRAKRSSDNVFHLSPLSKIAIDISSRVAESWHAMQPWGRVLHAAEEDIFA